MRRGWAKWVAWAFAALTVVLFGLTTWLGFARGGQVLLFGSPPQTWLDVLSGAPLVGLPIVAAVVITKQPTNIVGWVMGMSGVVTNVTNFSSEYAVAALLLHRNLPLGHFAWWLGFWLWVLGTTSVPLVLLLFPNGRFLTRRWRWVGVAALVNMGAVALTQMFIPDPTGSAPLPNPVGIEAAAPVGKIIGFTEGPVLVILALLGVISFLLRYRRSDSEVRHQLKWLLFALVLIPPSFLLNAIANPGPAASASALTVASSVLQFISQSVFLVAFAVAILKYRLYDIDVVISRTLVYGSLAAFITAVYVGIVVGVGTLVGSGGQPNLLLSIIATAIVAVAFQPVRERLNRIANRLVYGKRATPYEVLSQFSERVAETYAADEALPRMARVLGEGTGAEKAEVWLRRGGALLPAAAWPDSPSDAAGADADGERRKPPLEAIEIAGQELPQMPGADRAAAVRHQGELLGALIVTKRRGESLTPVEDKLLSDLASQAGLVLKNVGLTAELLQRLEELRASRQRLVAAQDEERRKLERNLHDGAQQNLVALKVKLGLAEALAEKDPARARDLVVQLKSEADEALETLRDLARGIYPPLLADKGLIAAIEGQARKATLPVTVEAKDVGRYPQDVEAAVYFCVLEALQNVQKYAGAGKAVVRLREDDHVLDFEVADDGAGFDTERRKRGAGLQNMEDRLDALGGRVELESSLGNGTRLRGKLPTTSVALAG
ncbi:MAG: histidine kinase [Candidatus Dormiibacterota bacterium]